MWKPAWEGAKGLYGPVRGWWVSPPRAAFGFAEEWMSIPHILKSKFPTVALCPWFTAHWEAKMKRRPKQFFVYWDMYNMKRQNRWYYLRKTHLEQEEESSRAAETQIKQMRGAVLRSVKSSCHRGWLLGSRGQRWKRHQDSTLATVS